EGGARVGFGLDAAGLNESQDALTDLRLGLVLQRQAGWDRHQVTAADMLALATHGGAPALGVDVALGRLEPGDPADVRLVDPRPPPCWSIAAGCTARPTSARSRRPRRSSCAAPPPPTSSTCSSAAGWSSRGERPWASTRLPSRGGLPDRSSVPTDCSPPRMDC